MLPVRVEGEAQGVAAPQHQLADLVDGNITVDVHVDGNVALLRLIDGMAWRLWRGYGCNGLNGGVDGVGVVKL